MNTQTIQITLTVFFDGRMWVAYFERRCSDGYSVYEEPMVKEPTENDLYMWITYGYGEIVFSRPVADDQALALGPRQLNYKQMQRASRRLLTKADEPVRAREALHAERTQKKREQIYKHLMALISERKPAKLTTDTRSDKAAMVDFIESKGYTVVQSEPVSELDVTQFDAAPFAELLAKIQSDGIHIYSLTQLMAKDTNWKRNLYELNWSVIKDIPSHDEPTKEPWEVFEKRCDNPVLVNPQTRFFAVDTTVQANNGDGGIGAYVGLSNFEINKVNPALGHTGLTGVVRSHRRKGIATALKVRALSHAKALGVTSIETGNDENNPMLDLNVQLGFKPGPAWVAYQKILSEE